MHIARWRGPTRIYACMHVYLYTHQQNTEHAVHTSPLAWPDSAYDAEEELEPCLVEVPLGGEREGLGAGQVANIPLCIDMFGCICVCICRYKHVCVCVCIYICMYMCMYVYTYVYMYIYVYIHTYISLHIHRAGGEDPAVCAYT